MISERFKLGVYRHYKGDLFTAIGLVTHHETRLPMVLYVSHGKGCVNARPLNGWTDDPDGWMDDVELENGRVRRFVLVKESSVESEAKQLG